MCPDQAAELADISFGDAWLPEFKHEKTGISIIVSRTMAGENLIKQARAANVVSLIRSDIKKIEQSQRVNMKIKKSDLSYRLSFLKSMGRATPRFNPSLSNQKSFFSALRTFYMYFTIAASANKYFRLLLTFTPLPLIRLYYGIYRGLSLI